MLLSRRFPSFKKLDLGCIETLALYATEFMKALSRPQDLKEITFASIKYDPSHYPIQIIEPILFEKCTSLQVSTPFIAFLVIDYRIEYMFALLFVHKIAGIILRL